MLVDAQRGREHIRVQPNTTPPHFSSASALGSTLAPSQLGYCSFVAFRANAKKCARDPFWAFWPLGLLRLLSSECRACYARMRAPPDGSSKKFFGGRDLQPKFGDLTLFAQRAARAGIRRNDVGDCEEREKQWGLVALGRGEELKKWNFHLLDDGTESGELGMGCWGPWGPGGYWVASTSGRRVGTFWLGLFTHQVEGRDRDFFTIVSFSSVLGWRIMGDLSSPPKVNSLGTS